MFGVLWVSFCYEGLKWVVLIVLFFCGCRL